MSTVDSRAAADAHIAGGPRAFVRDLLTDRGTQRVALRFGTAAWLRIFVVVPLVAVPAGIGIVGAARNAHDPETARRLIVAFAVAVGVVVAASAAIAALGWVTGSRASRIKQILTFVTVTAELATVQIGTHAVGTLTSHGVIYSIVAVALYRAFFDYTLGLYTAVVACIFFLLSLWLATSGIVPPGAIFPSFDLIVYDTWWMGLLVAHTVVVALGLTFCIVNYAVNQSANLHRYITHSVLRRYLPASLVDRAARGELRLDAEPERRVVTVLFTDLVGFTSMSERIDERDVARMLNRYLSRCAEVAHAHGATIDKFIGDAVMVLVGAPDDLAPEDQARRCVAIARDMQAALADSPLQMRAGINTGEVIVGHFGSNVRSDFTAVGHAVNMAARLETACEPGRVLVGEATARLLDGKVDLEPAGEFQLKGISKPVRAYYAIDAEPPA